VVMLDHEEDGFSPEERLEARGQRMAQALAFRQAALMEKKKASAAPMRKLGEGRNGQKASSKKASGSQKLAKSEAHEGKQVEPTAEKVQTSDKHEAQRSKNSASKHSKAQKKTTKQNLSGTHQHSGAKVTSHTTGENLQKTGAHKHQAPSAKKLNTESAHKEVTPTAEDKQKGSHKHEEQKVENSSSAPSAKTEHQEPHKGMQPPAADDKQKATHKHEEQKTQHSPAKSPKHKTVEKNDVDQKTQAATAQKKRHGTGHTESAAEAFIDSAAALARQETSTHKVSKKQDRKQHSNSQGTPKPTDDATPKTNMQTAQEMDGAAALEMDHSLKGAMKAMRAVDKGAKSLLGKVQQTGVEAKTEEMAALASANQVGSDLQKVEETLGVIQSDNVLGEIRGGLHAAAKIVTGGVHNTHRSMVQAMSNKELNAVYHTERAAADQLKSVEADATADTVFEKKARRKAKAAEKEARMLSQVLSGNKVSKQELGEGGSKNMQAGTSIVDRMAAQAKKISKFDILDKRVQLRLHALKNEETRHSSLMATASNDYTVAHTEETEEETELSKTRMIAKEASDLEHVVHDRLGEEAESLGESKSAASGDQCKSLSGKEQMTCYKRIAEARLMKSKVIAQGPAPAVTASEDLVAMALRKAAALSAAQSKPDSSASSAADKQSKHHDVSTAADAKSKHHDVSTSSAPADVLEDEKAAKQSSTENRRTDTKPKVNQEDELKHDKKMKHDKLAKRDKEKHNKEAPHGSSDKTTTAASKHKDGKTTKSSTSTKTHQKNIAKADEARQPVAAPKSKAGKAHATKRQKPKETSEEAEKKFEQHMGRQVRIMDAQNVQVVEKQGQALSGWGHAAGPAGAAEARLARGD